MRETRASIAQGACRAVETRGAMRTDRAWKDRGRDEGWGGGGTRGGGEVVDHVGTTPCEGGLQGLVEDETLVGGALAGSPSEVLGGEGDVEEGVKPRAR